MNINRITTSNITSIYKKAQSESQKINNKSTVKDDVVLSESGKIFNAALKSVQDIPEVREAKVNEIANQIKTGAYKINKEDLVNKMVTNAFFIK